MDKILGKIEEGLMRENLEGRDFNAWESISDVPLMYKYNNE